jgi:hypothetical protein
MVIAIIAVLIVSTLLSLGLYVQITILSRTIDLLREKQNLDFGIVKYLEHRISVLETINENKG